jgi:hypothetical protein
MYSDATELPLSTSPETPHKWLSDLAAALIGMAPGSSNVVVQYPKMTRIYELS